MRSYASAVIEAPVDTVWAAVRDFDGLPVWHPAIASSEIEDGLAAASVGCVRRLQLADGGEVRERLVSLDDVARSYTYEFVTSPFPVRSYRSTIHVLPVTASGHSFVEWCADFDADADVEAEMDRTFAQGVYATGLKGLAAHLSR
ncbi:SRPBCC family protein [Saccharopolyspora dendranthemae]|uniref:Polyketide cyclase/dehydrase/lipid transport protein n=1 Tax=Saccharopolyspora dendranthemae TaxID=1181886 RepID=A0A561VAN2_9PSEU|nr:SRPBCC family protein [Saccharopolyspora dendranthemae]TWG08679.1 polyketide cyclase/dehydrase/lipid transport protein [Saccharopolyspora dendranthemae]